MDVLSVEAEGKKAHTFRSVELKRRIVEETLKAGVSVSSVARAHGINANQVFQWRKLYQEDSLDPAFDRGRMRLLPVAVLEQAEPDTIVALGADTPRRPSIAGSLTGNIELSWVGASCVSRAQWMPRRCGRCSDVF